MNDVISKILFPFRTVFTSLNLKQHWWHRLAIVLFAVGVLGTIGAEAVAMRAMLSLYTPDPIVLRMYDGQFERSKATGIDFDFIPLAKTMTAPDNSNTSRGRMYDVFDRIALQDEIEAQGSRVQVPEVGIIAFPKQFSNIKIAQLCRSVYEHVSADRRNVLIHDLCIGSVIFVAVFYLLQISYRTLIYVARGR